jgi:hypothetical protein
LGVGWRPDGDLNKKYNPMDYIWKPPQGPKQGLRILKVPLPVKDGSDRYRVLR